MNKQIKHRKPFVFHALKNKEERKGGGEIKAWNKEGENKNNKGGKRRRRRGKKRKGRS